MMCDPHSLVSEKKRPTIVPWHRGLATADICTETIHLTIKT